MTVWSWFLVPRHNSPTTHNHCFAQNRVVCVMDIAAIYSWCWQTQRQLNVNWHCNWSVIWCEKQQRDLTFQFVKWLGKVNTDILWLLQIFSASFVHIAFLHQKWSNLCQVVPILRNWERKGESQQQVHKCLWLLFKRNTSSAGSEIPEEQKNKYAVLRMWLTNQLF